MAMSLFRAGIALMLGVLVCSCETSATQILLTVTVAPELRDRADRVEVETLEATGTAHGREVFHLVDQPGGRFSLGVVPRGGNADSVAVIWVGLYRADRILMQREQMVQFESGRTIDIRVDFEGGGSPDGGVPDVTTDPDPDAFDVPVFDTFWTDSAADSTTDSTSDADVPGCMSPSELCGGICVDTSVASNHCGGCSIRCDTSCSGGVCTAAMCMDSSDCVGELCCEDIFGQSSCTPGGACPEVTEAQCMDGVDNDTDGAVDCEDFSCDGTTTCS